MFSDTFYLDKVLIRILSKQNKKGAGEIGEYFDLTGATMSYHLNQLKKAGLVFEMKEKNFVYYQLNTSVMEEMILWLSQFGGAESKSEEAKKDKKQKE